MKALNYYSKLKHDNFSLLYMGEFDDDLTGFLMEIQETSSVEGRGTKKRVSYLIAECFQNIIRHTEEGIDQNADLKSKMFLMRNIYGTHYLATTNPVRTDKQEALRESLESLRNLSSEELKNVYLNALVNNSLSDKGGGGLGLIEMARKTKNPPQYHFEPINEEYSNFFLQIVMGGDISIDKEVEIKSTLTLYDEMLADNIVLLRKGDFSQEAILPLFRLFESNLQIKKEDLVFKKKSLYIMIELLQNMNRHAIQIDGSKEGLFTISMKDNVYSMETGNFIANEKVSALKSHLSSLQGLDKAELGRRYKQQLLSNSLTEDQGAGIGIIEMFRQSDGEILFNFAKVDEHKTFFTLSATL